MRKVSFAGLLMLVLVLLAGCSSSNVKSEPATAGNMGATQKVKIRFVDFYPGLNNIFMYLGIEKGFFAEQGLELDIKQFGSGPEILAAVAGGEIDVGNIGSPAFVGIARGVPIKIIGSPALRGNTAVLVARPDIQKVQDLQGKVVGVNSLGGGPHQALRIVADKEGLADAQFKVVATGSEANSYTALETGKVDAILVSEPFATKAELAGKGRTLAVVGDYLGHYQHSSLFASKKYIASNPDAIRRFIKAYRKSVNYAKTHQDEVVAFGSKLMGLDENLLKRVVEKEAPRWDDTAKIDLEGINHAVSMLKEVGDIDKSFNLKAAQMVEPGFVED